MRDDLDIATGQFGALVALYFLAGTVAAVPGGQLAEHLGARRGLMVTGSVTSISLILIALVVGSWLHLAIAMVVAGCANGMVHPAGNLAIVRDVRPSRQGTAFGVKQAAAPLATMFAGLALPTIGLTVGWPTAFLIATLLFPIAVFTLPRDLPSDPGVRRKSASRPDRTLLMIAAASALAFGAATTVGAFLVDSVVTAGGEPALAGATLTVASAACIGVRLMIGWQTDRMTTPSIRLVAGLMAVGAGGFAILAAAPPLIGALGAVIAMAAGWGWPGLLYHAVAAAHPLAPANATAVATTGNALGATLGPLSFGLIADHFTFNAAWTASFIAMLLGAGLMLLATRIGKAMEGGR
jgi:predicted MFS family arabinose efflux permease